ncbi:hypothetical protein V2G26_011531 [Clonostachys chloroleuca]
MFRDNTGPGTSFSAQLEIVEVMPKPRVLQRASIRRNDCFINFEDFASNATIIMQTFKACHCAIWRFLFFLFAMNILLNGAYKRYS